MKFIDALKARHSEYALSKDINTSQNDIENILKDIITYTPSAFNSQSQRVMLLVGEKHDQLWNQLIEIMKGIVKTPEQFEKTKEKLNGFKAAYGTVLFFDDMAVIHDLQKQYPLYKDNFSKWSVEQNGMLQSNVWVGLSTKGLGASLQHYNELIEEFIKKTYDIPLKWELRAQMPFGKVEDAAKEKQHMDINKRLIVKK